MAVVNDDTTNRHNTHRMIMMMITHSLGRFSPRIWKCVAAGLFSPDILAFEVMLLQQYSSLGLQFTEADPQGHNGQSAW